MKRSVTTPSRRNLRFDRVCLSVAASLWLVCGCSKDAIVVGGKSFNESSILGEIMAQLLEAEGFQVERQLNLGGTKIVYDSLLRGGVDVYVEYTGTLEQVIFRSDSSLTSAALRQNANKHGLVVLDKLGFNNSYALGTRKSLAQREGLATISDLVSKEHLRVFVTHEFVEREDGWPGLMAAYGFTWQPRGIEHAIAYRALAEGQIDVTDLYTTDGEIPRYDLHVLEDDKGFFPRYDAVPLARRDLGEEILEILNRVAGTIDDAAMQRLNAQVLFEETSAAEAARQHLATLGITSAPTGDSNLEKLATRTVEHLVLTAAALVAATAFALTLVLSVFSIPWLARAIAYGAGLLQTIPAIALLALMVPLFDIGFLPAFVALFLYSLLPIVRSSLTALTTVDPLLIRVAMGAGFTRLEELWHIRLPLSLPAMLSGVRVAAVICIGTATLAAFIGAGGLGEFIVQGLTLNNMEFIMIGAGTAAIMAILVELLFELVEKWVIPEHFKLLQPNTGQE